MSTDAGAPDPELLVRHVGTDAVVVDPATGRAHLISSAQLAGLTRRGALGAAALVGAGALTLPLARAEAGVSVPAVTYDLVQEWVLYQAANPDGSNGQTNRMVNWSFLRYEYGSLAVMPLNRTRLNLSYPPPGGAYADWDRSSIGGAAYTSYVSLENETGGPVHLVPVLVPNADGGPAVRFTAPVDMAASAISGPVTDGSLRVLVNGVDKGALTKSDNTISGGPLAMGATVDFITVDGVAATADDLKVVG